VNERRRATDRIGERRGARAFATAPVGLRHLGVVGVLGTLGLATSLACAPTSRSVGAPPPRPVNATPIDDWAISSWEDRHDTMTFAVLPTMSRLFQRFDAAPYPDMTCRTCHGHDAEAVHYAMPHGLPALDPAHLPAANDADPKTARVAKFMHDDVTPTMVDLLGTPPYDPKTQTGFSCFNCHPSAGSSAPGGRASIR
jgi:hypothetical protein